MVDFRKKLLGLAGMAVAFAGMANAQGTLVCSSGQLSAAATFIRAEGQTEALPTINITGCANGIGNLLNSSANITVYFSPAVTVTSAVTGNPGSNSTEAQIISNTSNVPVYGTVNGSSIVFSGVPITNGTTSFTIDNVRVNATSIPTNPGQAPTAITAQAFVSGTNVTPGPTNAPAVAYALSGLSTTRITKEAAQANTGSNQSSPYGVCNSINGTAPATATFYANINENFQNAFRTKAHETTNIGVDPTVVNSGTRVKLTFANVPAGLNIFVPITVTAVATAAELGAGTIAVPNPPALPVLTLQNSETGATNGTSNNNSTAASSPSAVTGLGLVQVPVTNGSATAVYEVTVNNLGALDVFSVPVFLQAGTNAVTNQTGTMTVSTSFAPITAATTIPSFAVGNSSATVNVLSTTLCTTSLLFPFVTNQAGFETGLAISNTSKDPFGSAKPQSGTCTLNYYGTSATNPSSTLAPNTNETTGAPYQAGEAYAFTLTNALAATAGNPATFQGYIIAQCQFQNAHGFAYIVYNFPGTSSDTMGYLALVLGRGSNGAETLGH